MFRIDLLKLKVFLITNLIANFLISDIKNQILFFLSTSYSEHRFCPQNLVFLMLKTLRREKNCQICVISLKISIKFRHVRDM